MGLIGFSGFKLEVSSGAVALPALETLNFKLGALTFTGALKAQ